MSLMMMKSISKPKFFYLLLVLLSCLVPVSMANSPSSFDKDDLKIILTVVGVVIALSAEAGSVHRDWTRILNEAKKGNSTSTYYTPDWHRIIAARLLLLQHSDCFRYGYSCVTRHWRVSVVVSKRFKQLCEVERKKRETIDIESLVTILVAVKGAHNLPKIRNTDDMNKALNSLRDICSNSDKVMGVDVFLTPKYETCSLSQEELLQNYTHLVN
ncbi:hypothetical protein COLO4_04251 [Corchorus olitorius]|uniref:Uncharacterized protein n=1 Tax=Corchorus olitorius TaxID=93759 RepID=A0A1R3KUQ7_9ROSI|nr:hypothetical protein COLO4_04251 [Corchorus olitorius]